MILKWSFCNRFEYWVLASIVYFFHSLHLSESQPKFKNNLVNNIRLSVDGTRPTHSKQ